MKSSATGMVLSLDVQTLPALLQAAAVQYGDRIFIEDEGKTLSFIECQDDVSLVARGLIARGIQAGDAVAIWCPNNYEWIIAAFAIQSIGAVLVPLNTRYKGAEAAQVLDASRSRLLFCIGEFLGQDYVELLQGQPLPQLVDIIVLRHRPSQTKKASVIGWQDLLRQARHISKAKLAARTRQVAANDIADILFTSGTTGAPKGVMASHAQNLKLFASWADILSLHAQDRYLVVNPFFHSFGFKAGILACLLTGATLLPQQIFDAEVILERISRQNISVLPGTPTLFQSLLAHPKLDQYDISSLKKTTTGGANIPFLMIEQMFSKLGFERVISAYGLTESTGLVTMCRHGDSHATIANTSGRVVPGVELRCVDRNNNAVPPGVVGEIVVRGFNVMAGYFADPAATEQVIDSAAWLHTGDLGCVDRAGNLKITDRLKDMFISGGFNCYPAEIENLLGKHPAIAMVAVIGIADERMGEVAMAFVVKKPRVSLTASELKTWSRGQMANFKVPRRVKFLAKLPLNASGKVLKTELKHLISKKHTA